MRKKTFSLLAGFAAGCILKLFICDILYVSGSSMTPKIHEGEFIAVNKLAYGIVKPFSAALFLQWTSPKTGDVIIYLVNNKSVVKRCVAVAGDPLEFSADSGYSVTVGGTIIPLKETQYQRLKYSNAVPQGTVFAVGDNFAESTDSRDYGFVSTKNIFGKVLCK